MPSCDKRIVIERYPEYDNKGKLVNVSFGCCSADNSKFPDLMGYVDIVELLSDIEREIKKRWRIR